MNTVRMQNLEGGIVTYILDKLEMFHEFSSAL